MRMGGERNCLRTASDCEFGITSVEYSGITTADYLLFQ
jgi:hypothetical protein